MKFIDVPQGSVEWFQARLGKPSSSCFSKIITPTGKVSTAKGAECYEGTDIPRFSQTAESYAHLLLAQIITGEVLEGFAKSYWMERGSLLEDEAAQLYEFESGYNLLPGGFILEDGERWGASPDRRIVDKSGKVIGGLEIKCPAPWTHVENLLKNQIDRDYIPQVQGQMLVGDLDFVDWFSYYPGMPPAIIRTHRDEEYIKKLRSALEMFNEMLSIKKRKLIELGALETKTER